MSPAAEFAGKTERLEVSGRVAADFVSYYGGQESRFTNLFLPLTLRYKTETDLLGFTGGFTRDNTLMGELLDHRPGSALYTTEPMDGQSVLDQAHH